MRRTDYVILTELFFPVDMILIYDTILLRIKSSDRRYKKYLRGRSVRILNGMILRGYL